MPAPVQVDPAFHGVGQKPGIEVWRIEKLKVVLQDPQLTGKFYTGDSYIVLVTRQVKNRLEWDLHFWLGAETTQDEAGICAYKTVELDESLGGFPVQYREAQYHESKKFLNLFPKGIEYLSGGIDSGFVKVDRNAYTKKLLHVKGKRNIRVEQVPLTYKSLNHGDVFVLDDGKIIFCWNGKDSSKRERVKATEVARRIKDEERGGKAKISIVDAGVDSETRFFRSLGDSGPIASAEEGGDDSEFERKSKSEIKLYRVSDASGMLTIDLAASAPLKQEHLDPDDCFILDAGVSGVFSWIGKRCTAQEKKAAMSNAVKFIQDKGYPTYTQATRIVQGGETPMFKQFFSDWYDEGQQNGLGKVDLSNIATYDTSEFDVNLMHKMTHSVREKCVDDGTGKVKVWRVEKFNKRDMPENEYGIFYEGDCYVILYTYKLRTREEYIIYFWQGNKSTPDEKGASALIAQKLDEQYGGQPVQIRVTQNKEPEHFLRMFQGKMIIKKGGIESGFRKRIKSEGDHSKAVDGVQLFQIRGTSAVNTRAVEVTARAASLNSNDVFLMRTTEKAYVWEGSGASEDEKAFAEVVADFVAPDGDLLIVREGKETKEFWKFLGGKEDYSSDPRFQEATPDHPPRLFQCSNASGRFLVEEVYNFDQEDLCEDDVMLLDTYTEIFIWVGNGANFIEKKESLNTAVNYIKSEKSERTPENTNIFIVKQGYEPLNFTGNFVAWDPEKWSHGKTYEEIKRELGEEAAVTTIHSELAKYNKVYPYDVLVARGNLLDGVDPCNKEDHLDKAEFEKYFKMTKEFYQKLPKWKREAVKKKLCLF